MKRPLFWAVTAFALGEVEGLCQSGAVRIGIAFAVLICAVLWSGRRSAGQYLKYYLVYVVCAVAGFFNAALREPACVGLDMTASIHIEGYVCDLLPRAEGSDAVICTESLGYKMKLLVYKAPDGTEIGDYVGMEGKVEGFPCATNPGEFDSERYYRARGIDGVLRAASYGREMIWEKLPPPAGTGSFIRQIQRNGYRIRGGLYRLRSTLKSMLYTLDAETAGIYAGLLLGDKSGIDKSLSKLYQSAGISHILAISGTHISLLGLGFFWLLRRLGVGFSWASAWAVLFLVCYGTMTGGSLSTVRAVIMLSYVFLGRCIGRGADLLTGAAAAMVIMLVWKPSALLDGGFLLSFTAISGVALGQYLLRRLCGIKAFRIMKKKRRLIYRCIACIVMAVSVQAVLSPVLARLYYVLPAYSVFCNLIVLPTMPVVLVSGMAGLLIGGFFRCPALGNILFSVGGAVLKLYEWICRLTLSLPFHSINVGKPSWMVLILYYALLLLLVFLTLPKILHRLRLFVYRYTHRWYQKPSWVKRMVVVYMCLLLFGGLLLYRLHRYSLCEQVVFLDVGQGDGILIRAADGSSIVIDGGSSSRDNLGEYVLVPALQSLGMARVDYWFVSHTDTDHISGLRDILQAGELSGIHIENIVFSAYAVSDNNMEELLQLATERGIRVNYMREGEYVSDRYSFLVACIHPDKDFAAVDINQASLALIYRSANFTMMFTGDMDTAALEHMLADERNRKWLIRYDVIKAAHHGSKYSCLPELYDMADAVVISCGEGNLYGHPHAELLEELERVGVSVRRTDEEGSISFKAH